MTDGYECYLCGRPIDKPEFIMTFTRKALDGAMDDAHDFFLCPDCFMEQYGKILKMVAQI